MRSVWAGPWLCLPNLPEGVLLIVCLDWALCRPCLCVELQSPGCTVCCQVSPNVCLQICLKELLLMSSWITHNLSSNLSAEWCVLSELGPDYVCQIFLKGVLLIVCLDWALWRPCLCVELQSACFTIYQKKSCLIFSHETLEVADDLFHIRQCQFNLKYLIRK